MQKIGAWFIKDEYIGKLPLIKKDDKKIDLHILIKYFYIFM